MEQKELLQVLKTVLCGFSPILGEHTELALHDLEIKKLVYIVNGHITGRQAGHRMAPSVYDTMLELAGEDGFATGYHSRTADGKPLRSVHFILRDPAGQPKAMVCINQDTSDLERARDILNGLICARSIVLPVQEDDVNYIQKMTQQVIVDAIQREKPAQLNTKEAKLEVLRKLELQGVFAVKDAVPSVCQQLSISQATLYNYLREIRSQEPAPPADPRW